MTVTQYNPGHEQTGQYRQLAEKILYNDKLRIPTPIDMDELERLLIDFGVVEDEEKEAYTWR
ncbi:Nitrogenase iron protein [compost metagenome]